MRPQPLWAHPTKPSPTVDTSQSCFHTPTPYRSYSLLFWCSPPTRSSRVPSSCHVLGKYRGSPLATALVIYCYQRPMRVYRSAVRSLWNVSLLVRLSGWSPIQYVIRHVPILRQTVVQYAENLSTSALETVSTTDAETRLRPLLLRRQLRPRLTPARHRQSRLQRHRRRSATIHTPRIHVQ
jgi:hypothetical protein